MRFSLSIEKISHFEFTDELFKNKKLYNLKEDPRFDQFSDNTQLLNSKIESASENFIQFGILHRLQYDDDGLTENQKAYLKTMSSSSLRKEFITNPALLITFKDLEESDIDRLRMVGFEYREEWADFSVNEVLFELLELMNLDLLQEFRRVSKWQAVDKDWMIGVEGCFNKNAYFHNKKKMLLDRLEDMEWQKAGMFTEEDTKDLGNLLGMNRGKSDRDKKKLKVDKQSLFQFIEKINEFDERWELLETCRVVLLFRDKKKVHRSESQKLDDR